MTVMSTPRVPSPSMRIEPPASSTLATTVAKLSTPRVMQLGLVALGAALILFWSVGGMVIMDARQGVQTIARDTAPSVIAAQEIRAHLANMDANVANAGLTRGQAQVQAWKDYTTEQAALSEHLISAAQNITYGDAERNPILEITTGVQTYAGLIGEAHAMMALADQHESTAPDAALALIRQATALMNTTLLPAAGRLNDANEVVLNRTWESRQAAFTREAAGFIAAGVPALLILMLLQWFVASRVNRVINPGLLLASITMAGVVIWAGYASVTSAAALTSAKKDAFDSIRAMWKTRAVAYSANADESFFLLDASRKQSYANSFIEKISQLADVRFGLAGSRPGYLGNVNAYVGGNCSGRHPSFTGLLGAELENVTFAGECTAAAQTYRTLSTYLDIDTKIRVLESAAQRDAAIAVNVGVKPGESNYAFDLFDQSLGKVIAINQQAFEAAVAQADQYLGPLPWLIGIGGVLVALFAFLGLRPRLNEYRA
jgi:hypothetical protein